MSRRTVISSAEKMLERGLIPESHVGMFKAEIRFLKSLSPASLRALRHLNNEERKAYLKATEKERAQMVSCHWGTFLSAIEQRADAEQRNKVRPSSSFQPHPENACLKDAPRGESHHLPLAMPAQNATASSSNRPRTRTSQSLRVPS